MLSSPTRQTDWRRSNPSKYAAHLRVQQALHAGQLHKAPCEVCGAVKVDAHHDSYDEPLVVRWLCRRHHIRLHTGGEDLFGRR